MLELAVMFHDDTHDSKNIRGREYWLVRVNYNSQEKRYEQINFNGESFDKYECPTRRSVVRRVISLIDADPVVKYKEAKLLNVVPFPYAEAQGVFAVSGKIEIPRRHDGSVLYHPSIRALSPDEWNDLMKEVNMGVNKRISLLSKPHGGPVFM